MARSIRSFLFFVLATLVLVNAVSIDHGYISTISRQTSSRVLSFRADLSSLSSLTNIEASYSIGISSGSTEILNWRTISNLQAVNTITETFATPIPDDYTVYLNLKVVDTNAATENIVNSSPIKVGNRLSSDAACADIFNPVGTSTVTPPQPAITVSYNNGQQKFNFNVAAKYLLQGWTWVIDFVPFTGDYTKGTKGLAATNCENRQTADLTGRAFADFWNAAPASDATTALNSKNYLAYRLGTASPKWSVSSTSCDTVQYTTPNGFSFDDLLDCRYADGNTPAIVRTIVGNAIQYNGTLYVTAVKAVNPLDETEGFQVAQFTAPFFVSFSVSSTAISSGTDNNIFAFQVASLNLQADGNLALSLATNTFANGFYLTSPSVTSAPPGVTLTTTGTAPANTQLQTWAFKTSTPKSDYSGIYAIQFTRTDGTSSVTVTAQFTLSLSVNTEYGNTGNILPTTLSFWGTTSFDGQSKTTYTSLDTIYIKSTITIQNGQDESSYNNNIYNVWLCYTVDDSEPVYNPTNNQFGCTAQTWNIRPITQIVANGAEVTSGALESQFATDITNSIAGLTPINAGFEFKAAPLAALRSGKFWVQVESRIALPARKRFALADTKSVDIKAFEISNGVLTGKTPIASAASVAQIAFGAAFLAAMLLF